MPSPETVLLSLGLGIAGSLIAAAIIWLFRRQVRDVLVALDMSTGAAFAWFMAFIMLAVIIVFPLVGVAVPGTLTGIFAFIIGVLLGGTVYQRK